ncbi:hypothetical protein SPRG_14128 [Saprolegnia parasitica CBS 223.65]|uniref:Myb-like DNA-binding protein n=1 Tax=Saprolegnia parasitica (strain CBS 223.65) TaxID=695850 RepID=A0A067C258_SAPPC|nr:hypothetical protein SPRG_14128 [Saprolegnia parasitica CBS 223.65]KDO20897.1 hypothetical protein SPRG_14128 [Saprolegnia parasitica CBS 223.65]|eukprot:XP_012208386.1 hypothetical protein SPRG_14128 [Saprolegnia parasitica CBS 223.65]
MDAIEAALAANFAYVRALEAYVQTCDTKEAEIHDRLRAIRARKRGRHDVVLADKVAAATASRVTYTEVHLAMQPPPQTLPRGTKKRLLGAYREKRSAFFQVPCARVHGGSVSLYYTNPDVQHLTIIQQRYPDPKMLLFRKWKPAEVSGLNKAIVALDDDDGTSSIDWERVRAKAGLADRTPRACQLRHLILQEEMLEKACAWTPREDEALARLVATSHDWPAIANTLHTEHGFPPRLPVSCLIRYQTMCNNDLFPSVWTPEEDELLRDVMATMAGNESNIWRLVAEKLAIGHTPDQCGYRWRNHLCPTVKTGHFSVEEDRRLLLAMYVVAADADGGMTARSNLDWHKVQDLMPGRTNVMCSQRYRDSLNPFKKYDHFTEADDMVIAEGIRLHGTNAWPDIAAMLPGRYPDQIRKRWRAIQQRFDVEEDDAPTVRVRGKATASSVVKTLRRTTRVAKSTTKRKKSQPTKATTSMEQTDVVPLSGVFLI